MAELGRRPMHTALLATYAIWNQGFAAGCP
jgi:hypothetical protein